MRRYLADGASLADHRRMRSADEAWVQWERRYGIERHVEPEEHRIGPSHTEGKENTEDAGIYPLQPPAEWSIERVAGVGEKKMAPVEKRATD